MINSLFIKSNLKPNIYRTLHYLDPKLFPLAHEKTIDESVKDETIGIVVRTGLSLQEVKEYISKAIDGEENDFSNVIGGSSISDDNSDVHYIFLMLFGIFLALIIYNIIRIFLFDIL